MRYIHVTILASFLTDTLNWQVLWGKEKYLLVCMNSWKIIFLYNKCKTVKNLSLSRTNKLKDKYITVSFETV